MLWRALLRGSAVGLLTNALTAQGAHVQSSKDTPAPSGKMPWFVVYTDDKKHFDYGGAPRSRTVGTLTIEIRVEAPARVVQNAAGDNVDMGAQDAALLLDNACEVVQNALLGGQGFDVACTCTQGSPVIKPAADLLAKMFVGGLVEDGNSTDSGLSAEQFAAVQAIDNVGNVTLTEPWTNANGTYLLHFGSFIRLFEMIDQVETFTHEASEEAKNHIASATIEIVGHTTEYFPPPLAAPFKGVNLYVDCINIFDPQGTYQDAEPFPEPAPPRRSGPDGRPEIAGSVDLPQD